MFEKKLPNVLHDKRSYDLNSQTISGKEDSDVSGPKKTRRRCFLGLRHVATLVGFLNCFLQTANRLLLSVGIVAMVKHGQTEESSNRNASEISCPMPSARPKNVAGSNFQGEFDWSSELQGYIIGIGFLSNLFTVIPAGRLADSIGSKYLFVISNAAMGILTLISPLAARWHVYALMTVNFLKGGAQGLSTPAIYKMTSNWIPRNERGTLSTLVMCGYGVGAAIGGMVTGWLCDINGFGWPSAFYAWGIINFLLAVVFHFTYYEHPENHPWITDEELNYITDGLETKVSEKKFPTPWKKMFSSIPTYAYFYGLFGHYWSISYYVTVHPMFMGAVLHYPMTETGVTSCLPILMKSIGGVCASIIAYWISKKNLIGLNRFRKITTVFGAIGFSLCMVGILLGKCDAFINILSVSLSLFTSGIALSGVMIAGVDMAPAFAGSVMGVASAVATVSVVLIPVITGLVTTHETLSEWRIVFWINFGIVGSSGIVYALFGSAEVQSWNNPEKEILGEITTKEIKQEDKSINQEIEMNEKNIDSDI